MMIKDVFFCKNQLSCPVLVLYVKTHKLWAKIVLYAESSGERVRCIAVSVMHIRSKNIYIVDNKKRKKVMETMVEIQRGFMKLLK